MITVTKDQFLSSLKAGDVGLIHARNAFAALQNLYRKRFNEGDLQASHGFLMLAPPRIAEANGLFVDSKSTVIKNIGDKTQCWLFRYEGLLPDQLARLLMYVDGAVDAGGHYSVGGILQFAARFFGIHKKVADEGGVFCTEFTSDALSKAGIPYVQDRPAYEITPSYQLNWFLTHGPMFGWYLAAHYDGASHYFVAEPMAKAA